MVATPFEEWASGGVSRQSHSVGVAMRKLVVISVALFATLLVSRSAAAQTKFSSFTVGEVEVLADAEQLQTFDLRLIDPNNAIDEVRFIINLPAHSQNGRTYSGYLLANRSTCKEVSTGYGNGFIELATDSCVRQWQGGLTRFVIGFTLDPKFGSLANNQVSAVWYAQGAAQTGWKRVTALDAGFDVLSEVTYPDPAALIDTHVELDHVEAGVDWQRVEFTFADSERISQLLIMINHPSHAAEGNSVMGYFSMTPAGCREISTSYGNNLVELDLAACSIEEGDGVATWSLSFQFDPRRGDIFDNQISVLWYEDSAVSTFWKRATTLGDGFDITSTNAPYVPPSIILAGIHEEVVSNTDADAEARTQRATFWIQDPGDMDELRVVINLPNHAFNGQSYSGYLRFKDGQCELYPSARWKGNANLTLGECTYEEDEPWLATLVIGWVHNQSFGTYDENTVSYLVYGAGSPTSGWARIYNRYHVR